MFYHFHPYKPFLYKDTKKIIVGTLPPPRFCIKEYKEKDVLFCYGSQDGLLWQALDKIYNLKLLYNNSEEAVKQRKEFLKRTQIGICDIINSCKREKIDASDIGMKNVVLRDILFYLKKYTNIDTIIFTGGFCKNSPEYFFRKILKESSIKYEIVDKNIPKIHKFIFNNREFKTVSLTSPSNAANRSIGANSYYKKRKQEDSSYSTLDFRVEQYKKVFLESLYD